MCRVLHVCCVALYFIAGLMVCAAAKGAVDRD